MKARRGALGLAWLVLLAACEPQGSSSGRSADGGDVELGDIDRILERGRIRFANVARAEGDELPRLRSGSPNQGRLAQEFADRWGLELLVREYPSEEAARTALLDGEVDGIVGRSGPGIEPPPEGIAYSVPFTLEPGVFLGRAGEVPDSLAELAGRTVTFAPTSSLIGFSDSLSRIGPDVGVDVVDVPTVLDLVDLIVDGEAELTLLERWVAEAVVGAETSLATGAGFGEMVYTAAVRSSNPDLLRAVNDFRFSLVSLGEEGAGQLGDLPAIRERGVLRVLTLNGPSSYYVYKGDLVGFDLDLLQLFADEQDLIAQMVVAPSVDVLDDWLGRGLADMIAVGVVPSSVDTSAVRLTREYHDVYPVVVTRDDVAEAAYAGRTVVIARNSPYLPVLPQITDSVGATLVVTSDAESPGQLLERIEEGEADFAVLESHLAGAELPDHPSLHVVDSVPDAPGRSWAVRPDQPQLLAALDAFFDRQVGSVTLATLVRKHFLPDTRIVTAPDVREDGSLSPWDEVVRRYASEATFDWRLMTAQMFMESRFDPEARSPSGAYGLMQMMPATAEEMGVRNLDDPDEQIRAGVTYMDRMFNRFSPELDVAERAAFALASYNAGYGHVHDARRVAERMGLDPDRWFDNVEVAMLALSDPDVYASTLHGYVRGTEPVRYVRRVTELGQMYYRLAPAD